MDTVSYSGLKPDTKYEVTGILMDKETEEAIKVDGKDVTSSVSFEMNPLLTLTAPYGKMKI